MGGHDLVDYCVCCVEVANEAGSVLVNTACGKALNQRSHIKYDRYCDITSCIADREQRERIAYFSSTARSVTRRLNKCKRH